LDILEKVRICLLIRTTGLHGEDIQTKTISSRDGVLKYRRSNQIIELQRGNNKLNV